MIGAAYANPEGEGRITFADGPSAPTDDPAAGTEGEGTEGGSGGKADTGGAADTTGASGSGSGATLAKTGDATVASVAVLLFVTCAAAIMAIASRILMTRR